MSETQKAFNRRTEENWYEKYICVPGIDIGCGNDIVSDLFVPWDITLGNSDAQKMAGVLDEEYFTVYASHILEHVDDPVEALYNWYRILKPGGKLIVIVPHRDLYEQKKTLPSQWAPADHKTYWLPDNREGECTWGLRETIHLALPPEGWEIETLRVLDTLYESNYPRHPLGEYSIEVVVKKKRLEMKDRLGLTPCNEYYDIPDVRGKKVLEIGCNSGLLGKNILKGNPALYAGVDIWRMGGIAPELCSLFRYGDITRKETLPCDQQWDVVICFDVLYHLRDPLIAIENLCDLTTEMLVIGTACHPGEGVFLHFEPGYKGDPTNYWYPSKGCMEKMIRWFGLEPEVKYTYLESKVSDTFHDRICFHCRK